jgi:N-acetyl-anhydromuramyl-L-alanine amidase AmpD
VITLNYGKPPSFPHTKFLADEQHYRVGREVWPPRMIILHSTASKTIYADSRVWLARSSIPAVSSHILISRAGEIVRIVEDTDTAFHAGFSDIGPNDQYSKYDINDLSLGIELENTNQPGDIYPYNQLRATATMIVYWWYLYGFLPIIKHMQADSRKIDPQYFPDRDFSNHLANVLKSCLNS